LKKEFILGDKKIVIDAGHLGISTAALQLYDGSIFIPWADAQG
jgi:hypothetical protein